MPTILTTRQPSTTVAPGSASQSQISELSQKVQSLRGRADLANGAYIVFLTGTVLATMLLARWTAKANRAQDELTRAKDAELARELKEKDSQIEGEKLKRAELEKSLAPRTIAVGPPGSGTSIEPLKKFAGTRVLIRFFPDVEPKRAAEHLKYVVESAGWTVIETAPDISLERFLDGAVVETYSPPPPVTPDLDAKQEHSIEAAESLIDLLTAEPNNWWVWRGGPDIRFAPLEYDMLRVTIGIRPNPYLDALRLPPDKRAEYEAHKKVIEENRRLSREWKKKREQSPAVSPVTSDSDTIPKKQP